MAHAIAGELSFATVLKALDGARGALAAGPNTASTAFEVDLSGVTRADSAGLALLLELSREARAAGRELKCLGAPEQLRRLAGFFGVTEVLALT